MTHRDEDEIARIRAMVFAAEQEVAELRHRLEEAQRKTDALIAEHEWNRERLAMVEAYCPGDEVTP